MSDLDETLDLDERLPLTTAEKLERGFWAKDEVDVVAEDGGWTDVGWSQRAIRRALVKEIARWVREEGDSHRLADELEKRFSIPGEKPDG